MGRQQKLSMFVLQAVDMSLQLLFLRGDNCMLLAHMP